MRGRLGGLEDFLVVGIGASAGGLDAARKLMKALPANNGIAFILVQHLDPTHDSMMADLLAGYTTMTVRQAEDGMRLERDHLYVIPPGTYLSVVNGALRLSEPRAHHGARLPFDFLLHSLAEDYDERAVCVILSGTAADGSLGLKAVTEKGGLVIAQDPDEASHDGMPRNAILTDAVDLVLPVGKIPDALVRYNRRMALTRAQNNSHPRGSTEIWLPEIIELLRAKTTHDFRLYKSGTLQRRIERRMAMAATETDDMDRYLELLHRDAGELDLLAKDLLINVTSFFRDREVFDFLAEKIVPELVRGHPLDQPLRIWIAGCSTGEETYSLAMLFCEELATVKRDIKLQVFASDVDPDAVVKAGEGFYPITIETEVSPERLARFFAKEEHGYRVLPELRGMVVFTVQDVLADPPFSRLDLISCRNLLIYLRPDAQTKVISHFHSALREDGLLLLGNSETIANVTDRFESISKAERIYRHVGRARPGDLGFSFSVGDGSRAFVRSGRGTAPSHEAALTDLCRRHLLETYAPPAVLINREHECLYYLGPTDRYLHVPTGPPTHDLLAMTRRDIRIKLRSAIERANQEKLRIVVAGGCASQNDASVSFSIAVQPILSEGEELLLICFIDDPAPECAPARRTPPREASRVAELEQELEATRKELMSAIRSLEVSSEEQKAINEEALPVNEEYQSTNEELLTSKKELQSLNEELTALNGELRETLERQRTTSNDLQNVLYSTDVATLFLDTSLNIRFFTPATKALFSVIPSDVGRPLAELHSLSVDGAVLADAQVVLETLNPIEREIETEIGAWYARRILPYRTQDNGIEGVVITFADITERKHAAVALETVKREAQLANVAKSRFLAAASHDLRQPLQALSLMRGVLERKITENRKEEALDLLARLDNTAAAMSGMLNALLDINQLAAGTIQAELVSFPIADMLSRLKDEFTYHAEAQSLLLQVVSCELSIYSDPRLLEQMVRNLLSNALKYTRRGKVLLGCRRRKGTLSIEIWDTGIGIPDEELQNIFDEYHQVDNPVRERSRGLGLGLSIVRRLADLLGHRVHVRSRLGKGSVFTIDTALSADAVELQRESRRPETDETVAETVHRRGSILIVEDDPEVRELLEILLKDEGHHTAIARDGIVALDLASRQAAPLDLILADYNLPNGLSGLQVAAKLRERRHRNIPVIILTGDISALVLRDIALHDCIQLNKPVKPEELIQTIQRLLRAPPAPAPSPHVLPVAEAASRSGAIVFVVDDDSHVREGIRKMLETDGRTVHDFATGEAFFAAYRPCGEACLLIDGYLPGMSGLELLLQLRGAGDQLPSIMITGNGDVPMVVQAMKAGAMEFIEKPIGHKKLLASVESALKRSRDMTKLLAWRENAANRVASLTRRQRQIMDLMLAGHPSKNIATDLHISQRTVETHRATIMKKSGSKSLAALARLALAAAGDGVNEPLD